MSERFLASLPMTGFVIYSLSKVMRFLLSLRSVGMTARREKKEGADTAATGIRKTVTASAAVSAPSPPLQAPAGHSDHREESVPI